MIAIDLNNKRIRIKPVDDSLSGLSAYAVYLDISYFWNKSPWLPGSPPVGFDNVNHCLTIGADWEFQAINRHGDKITGLV